MQIITKYKNMHSKPVSLLLAFCLFLFPTLVKSQDHTGAFITVWDTEKMTSGTTLSVPSSGTTYQYYWERITLPVVKSDTNYLTNLGDLHLTAIAANTGIYKLYIKGTYTTIFMYSDPNSAKALIEVESWGNIVWDNMGSSFRNCSNLTTLPTAAPDLSRVTNMRYMFNGDTSLNSPIDNWNTSNVTNMSFLFAGAKAFNQPVGSWNTSNVTNMSGLFSGCAKFNQNLGSWDTKNVTDMTYMFSNTDSFNQNISGWKTEKAINLMEMFGNAKAFNQPIGTWNTKNVLNMSMLFIGATSFNQPLDSWDTKKVTDMNNMFKNARSFNQPIGSWNTEEVTDMTRMFENADVFNSNISSWKTIKVTDMSYMFNSARLFNQDLGSWELNTADVNMSYMLRNTGLDCQNYSLTLKGWATNPGTPDNVILLTVPTKYAGAAQPYKDTLIAKGWSINDGGVDASCIVAALPVQLVRYDARLQSGSVLLNWKTASEINNSHFIVSKSTDAIHFTELVTIEAKGNRYTAADYGFTDAYPATGKNYYKLSQVDLDGKTVQHGVKVIELNQESFRPVMIYPNPAQDQPATLFFTAGLYDKISLFDVNGRLLASKNISDKEETKIFETQKLEPGVYIFQLSGSQTSVQKLVKQ